MANKDMPECFEIVTREASHSVVQQALLQLSGRHTERSTAQIYAGTWVDFAAFLRVLHDDYPESYWRDKPWSGSATERRELLDYLDDCLTSVMTVDVNAYRLALLRVSMVDRLGRKKIGLEHSTVNRHLAALRYLWRVAMQLGLATMNPADSGLVPRHKTSRLYRASALKLEDFQTLLFGDQYEDTLVGRRDRMLIQFLGLTGCRRDEARRLKTEDFTRDREGLFVDLMRKGDKRQRLLLTHQVEQLLTEYIATDKPRTFVFPTRPDGIGIEDDEPLAVNSVTNLVRRRTYQILGIAISPHGLRRTFVTLALAGGASLAEVQRYVGHENPSTTMLYAEDVITRKSSAAEFVFGQTKGSE